MSAGPLMGEQTQDPNALGAPTPQPAAPEKPSLFKGILAGALQGLAASAGSKSLGEGLALGVQGQQRGQQQAVENQQAQRQQDRQQTAATDAHSLAQVHLADATLTHQHLAQMYQEAPKSHQEELDRLSDEQAHTQETAFGNMPVGTFKTAAEAYQAASTKNQELQQQAGTSGGGNFSVAVPLHRADGSVGVYVMSQGVKNQQAYKKKLADGSEVTVPAGTQDSAQDFTSSVGIAKQVSDHAFKTHIADEKAGADTVESNAKLMAEGKLAPSQIADRSGARSKAIARALQLNPDFDPADSESAFQSRKALDKAYTSGAPSQELKAIGTARYHMETFKHLASALGNGDVQTFNALANKWAEKTGNPAPTSFELAKAAFAGEVGKSFAGANVSLADREELTNKIKTSSSPAQFLAAANTADELLKGKQESSKETYDLAKKNKPNFGKEKPAPSSSKFDFSKFPKAAK